MKSHVELISSRFKGFVHEELGRPIKGNLLFQKHGRKLKLE
jgi:hypothetical protein